MQNWIPLTNLAREADRYGLGNRPTADIATAVLLDYGVIQEVILLLQSTLEKCIEPDKQAENVAKRYLLRNGTRSQSLVCILMGGKT